MFLVNSQDNGSTWNSNSACDLTPDSSYENVFASLAPRISDTLEIVFQRDYEPGLSVRGDDDPVDVNEIIALRVPLSVIQSCSIGEYGCTDPLACNYGPNAILEDNSCDYSCYGCSDAEANNYDPQATIDDGSCAYFLATCADIGSGFWNAYELGFYADEPIPTHMLGVPTQQDLVLHLPNLLNEPSTGSQYEVMAWDSLEFSGLPPGLAWSELPQVVAPNSQTCIPYEGTPAQTGLFEVSVTGDMTLSIFGQPLDAGQITVSIVVQVLPNPDPIPGCAYQHAVNFNPIATVDDGSCEFTGCTDPQAENFEPYASIDDGTCDVDSGITECIADTDGDSFVTTTDLLNLLAAFGSACE